MSTSSCSLPHEATNIPAALLARRRQHPDERAFRERLCAPLPIPSTAIYSRTDGILSWRSCCEDPGPLRSSIEIESSHLGMGHHPVVLLAIADRLRQPESAWSRSGRRQGGVAAGAARRDGHCLGTRLTGSGSRTVRRRPGLRRPGDTSVMV